MLVYVWIYVECWVFVLGRWLLLVAYCHVGAFFYCKCRLSLVVVGCGLSCVGCRRPVVVYRLSYKILIVSAQLCHHLLVVAQLCHNLLVGAQLCHHLLVDAKLCHHLLVGAQLSHHLLVGAQLSHHLLVDAQLCHHLLVDAQLCHHLLVGAQLSQHLLTRVKERTDTKIINIERTSVHDL